MATRHWLVAGVRPDVVTAVLARFGRRERAWVEGARGKGCGPKDERKPLPTQVPGFEVPAQIKEYVNNFFGAVEAAKILKECGGFAIAEFAASKDALK